MFRDLSTRLSNQPQKPSTVFDKAVSGANTVLDLTLRPAARAATALINTFRSGITGKPSPTITPQTNSEKIFYGDKPIGDIAQLGKTDLEGFGIQPKTQLGSQVLGSFLAPLALFISPE